MTYRGMTFTKEEIAEMLPRCPVCGGMLGKLPKSGEIIYECKPCGVFYRQEDLEGKGDERQHFDSGCADCEEAAPICAPGEIRIGL